MKWEAVGADRITGLDKTLIVDANDEASASRRASRQGLLVERIRSLDLDDSLVGVNLPVSNATTNSKEPEKILLITGLHPFEVFLLPCVACLILVGFLMLPYAYVKYKYTTFIVTNARITIRRGWLSKSTFEMLLQKVESVHVDQSFLGRLLGTGTIRICGTGGSNECFVGIRNAQLFRKIATDAIERRPNIVLGTMLKSF